jgi:hypothetical protein
MNDLTSPNRPEAESGLKSVIAHAVTRDDIIVANPMKLTGTDQSLLPIAGVIERLSQTVLKSVPAICSGLQQIACQYPNRRPVRPQQFTR